MFSIGPPKPPSVTDDKDKSDEVPVLHEPPSFELVVDNTGDFCQHRQRCVDKYRRVVTCGTCGAPLDPFDVLLSVAAESTRFNMERRLRKRETEEAKLRLAELLKLEKNAVSRLKRRGVPVEDRYERSDAVQGELRSIMGDSKKPRAVKSEGER